MGLWRRLAFFLRGKSNAVLDKLEKPEEQLSVFVDELNTSISKLQTSVAAAVADEKKLKMQWDELSRTADEWERKAVLALESGDEPLAKEALLKQQHSQDKAQHLKQAWESQSQATQKLKESLSAAKTRVEDAKRQYSLLLARYRTAETKQKIAHTLSASFDDSPMKFIEGLNDKILKIESETEANLELIGGSSTPDLEERFIKLEQQDRGTKALDALKKKLGEKKALSSGSSVDELKKKLG